MPKWTIILACSALMLSAATGCSSDSAPPGASAGNGLSQASPRWKIEPRADADLKRMSQTLGDATAFRLRSTATIDQRMESGQLVQFSRDSAIVVRRPDGFFAAVRKGPETHRFWHTGRSLTVLDVGQSRYAQLETPQRLDEMLDFLAEKHGLVVPLDDLLFPDPYKVLTEKVTSGVFVDQQEIEGRLCDHLLFTQDNLDWQIWIDTGATAVPRKIVITEKGEEDRPQYEAVLDGWEINPQLGAKVFVAELPAGAARVDMDDMTGDED